MKNYKDFLSRDNESWSQAIKRYKSFLETDVSEYSTKGLYKDLSYRFATNPAYQLYNTGKVSKQTVTDFIEREGLKIPIDLIDLMCIHGTFLIGSGILELFNKEDQTFCTLSQILIMYDYEHYLSDIGKGMLKSLNSYYFFFGVSFPQTDEASFLYFNKAGNFGKMHVSEMNPDQFLKKTLPAMFNGSIDKYTLDSLISNQIDRVIINALTVRGYID